MNNDNNEILIDNDSYNEIDYYEDALERLKEVRESLDKTDADDRNLVLDRLDLMTRRLEDNLSNIDEEYQSMFSDMDLKTYYDKIVKGYIDDLDSKISDIKKDLKNIIIEYEKNYNRLQEIIIEENEKIEAINLIDDVQFHKIRSEYLTQIIQLDDKAKKLKKEIDLKKSLISSLNRKKNKIEKDINNAIGLDLSVTEYNDITSTLRKRNIMNAILEEKGLSDIVHKDSSSRTKDEQKMLKEARKKILEEIGKFKSKNRSLSVLDAIEALYHLDEDFFETKKSRSLIIKKEQYNSLLNNVYLLPEKIVNPKQNTIYYLPSKAPKDLHLAPDLVEKIRFVYDENDKNVVYVRKATLIRFNVKACGDSKRIDNALYFPISLDDALKIENNANNDYSPYEILKINLSFNSNKNLKNSSKTRSLTFYRAINDDNNLYIDESFLGDFVHKDKKVETIDGVVLYKVSNSLFEVIKKICDSKNVGIDFKDIKIKKDVYSVEGILNKLTKGLDIKKKDSKRYKASNIKVSKNFKNELKSGNYLYNIVHVVSGTAKATVDLFRKISSKLLISPRCRDVCNKITDRLNGKGENALSIEEINYLFENYKGSKLKTDMNNQINPFIIDRLKEYGLNKVSQLNENIKGDYTNLFVSLGKMKSLEEKGVNQKSNDLHKAMDSEYDKYMDEAADYIKNIIKMRKSADDLLSSGVHGLEEDFKAISSKLNYIGKRFIKTKDFDNELQEKLALYENKLNEGLAYNDSSLIVNNFINLESCYFKNTDIKHSIFGDRSVGSKYYSPLASYFDYRNDPFITDLFTTVALTSAAVSCVNAIKVHKIEANNILDKQKKDINDINSINDETMKFVDTQARNISAKKSDFYKGMSSQVNQDVSNVSHMLERNALDMTNWKFGKEYHVLDNANHAFYNGFYQDVSKKINDITTSYGNGMINQTQALKDMANIANDAQNTLVSVADNCLSIIKPYAKNHPNFDLTATVKSLESIVNNPNNIIQMNKGMVDVVNLSDSLIGLDAASYTALQTLPSDMLSTIVCAASAAGLAYRVSDTMNNKYSVNKKYDNDIIRMMSQFTNGKEVKRHK